MKRDFVSPEGGKGLSNTNSIIFFLSWKNQAELAKLLGTKAPVVGRYERGEVNPSIEVAKNLSNILGVSLDYLVGNTDLELDSTVLKRVEDISKFSEEEQQKIYMVLDALIRDFKAQKEYRTA